MKRLLLALAAFAALVPAAVLHAQTYPTKPIKMIAPYPPGGATDILARLISQGLTESLGVPVVVVRRRAHGALADSGVATVPDARAAADWVATRRR